MTAAWEPTPKQEQTIALLASGQTLARTAQLAGVSVRTLNRWRLLPGFRLAVRATLATVLEQALAQLVTGVPDAVTLINRTHLGRGKVDRDRVSNAQWVVERVRLLGEQLGPADAPQPIQLTQSVSGSPDDLARLITLIHADRLEKRSLLVEPDDVAQDRPAPDPPPD